MGSPFRDLCGMKFGRLTAISPRPPEGVPRRWNCVCECGKESVHAGLPMVQGRIKSCGCYRREFKPRLTHGRSKTSMETTWRHMLERCMDPESKSYKNYGARGIKVCERWLDFTAFIEDMGDKPVGTSLDRIDVNGHYEPGNCRWATMKQQNRNRRNNRLIEYQGRTQCLSEWEEEFSLPKGRLLNRLQLGFTVADALTRPIRKTTRSAT